MARSLNATIQKTHVPFENVKPKSHDYEYVNSRFHLHHVEDCAILPFKSEGSRYIFVWSEVEMQDKNLILGMALFKAFSNEWIASEHNANLNAPDFIWNEKWAQRL